MADPRRRITEGLRGLNAPPPPRRAAPAPPTPAGPSAVEAGEENPPRPTLEEAAAASASIDKESAQAKNSNPRRSRARAPRTPGTDDLPGRAVGNKRSLVAHLPARVRDALDHEVAQEHTTKGVVIMRALREGHDQLEKRAGTQTAPVGAPFPPERRVRRRLVVPHRVPTTYTLWPDECEALQHVAETLDLNQSELVTEALKLRYKLDLDPSN